jgi:long-chain acyl-CoA synthetase
MSDTATVTDVHRFLAERAPNVGRMFLDRLEQSPDRPAYRFPDGASWTTVTWRQTGDRVRSLAAGLVALGIDPEERVAIVSGTRY